ncbi:hypothetical protein PIB30_042299 [Stylosanthes scabra]|uniref:Uncharacterized protein n=1 Tax=Stylosanthes scabra TaxID=79078 RepID=A0ABU6XFH9_9FABA|nr:hypothetical protein [Stylosanthes scabra]
MLNIYEDNVNTLKTLVTTLAFRASRWESGMEELKNREPFMILLPHDFRTIFQIDIV